MSPSRPCRPRTDVIARASSRAASIGTLAIVLTLGLLLQQAALRVLSRPTPRPVEPVRVRMIVLPQPAPIIETPAPPQPTPPQAVRPEPRPSPPPTPRVAPIAPPRAVAPVLAEPAAVQSVPAVASEVRTPQAEYAVQPRPSGPSAPARPPVARPDILTRLTGVLVSLVEREKFYPAAARRGGYTGTVLVAISVSHGRIGSYELRREGANPLLVRAARDILEKVRSHDLPDDIRDAEAVVEIPVVFNLTGS